MNFAQSLPWDSHASIPAMTVTPAKLKALLTTGRVNGNPVHRYLLAKVLLKSRLPGFIKFSTGNYRLWFHPSELSYQLYQNREYYRQDEEIMRRILRPGDVFVDVGANIGTWSLYASTLIGESGKVYAFEPHPRTAGFLKRNIDLNRFRNIEVSVTAVGDSQKMVMLEEKDNDSTNNIAENGTIPVPMTSLDAVLPACDIRLLKIDAEGSELQVLQGAARTLQRTQLVYIECWDSYFNQRGYRSLELLRILTDDGFSIDVPHDHGEEFHEDVLAYKDRAVLE
jgi:FkbM family methyltransferase